MAQKIHISTARQMLNSGEIRRVRDVCIFEINGCEVFL